MPFIAQCPHTDCRKFLLMEDEMQGQTVNCLLCKKGIELTEDGPVPAGAVLASVVEEEIDDRKDLMGAGDANDLQAIEDDEEIIELAPVSRPGGKDSSGKGGPGGKGGGKFDVRPCPKCGVPLKVAHDQKNKAIQCTECDFWGIV